MDIIWHGHSSFTIKGSKVTMVTDPYNDHGIKLPKLSANVVLLSDSMMDNEGSSVAPVEGEPFMADLPGEYEVGGALIDGFNASHFTKSKEEEMQNEDKAAGGDIVVFSILMEGIRICHLSGLGHNLTGDLTEKIGDVDILLVPVGGNLVLDAKKAHNVIETIEPRIVIPMYYNTPGSTLDLAGVDEFLKEMSKANAEPQDKLQIKGRSSLPDENMEIVILNPAN